MPKMRREMKMKLRVNPILKKELKLGARTFKFPLGISLYAAAFALMSLYILMDSTSWLTNMLYGTQAYWCTVSYDSLTRGFRFLAIFQVVMICVIVPVLTASSIAGERERQTLDIMLTAPVSSFSIAFGKLTAVLANVFMFIISTLPALALSFLYGGIEWQYLFIFMLDVMVLSFFIGAIGVWCSAIFKKTIVSVIMTMLLELLFFILPIVIYFIIYAINYRSVLAGTQSGQALKAVDMGWSGLILLFDPILTAINSLVTSTSSEDIISTVTTGVFNLAKPADTFNNLIAHWTWIGSMIMVLLGFFFLFLTARKIDAPGRKHGKRK